MKPSTEASKGAPPAPDIIKSVRETSPSLPWSSKVTKVPSPASITPPVSEKPRTVFAPLDTVNPAASAAPPPADTISAPWTLNWKPAISKSDW